MSSLPTVPSRDSQTVSRVGGVPVLPALAVVQFSVIASPPCSVPVVDRPLTVRSG
jgi:hypothetical protein